MLLPPLPRAKIVAYGEDEWCPNVVRGGWQLSSGHHASMDKENALNDLAEAAKLGYTCLDCGDIYSGVEELIGMHHFRNWNQDGSMRFALTDADSNLFDFSSAHGKLRVHTKFVPDIRVLGSVSEDHVRAVMRRSMNRLGQEQLDLVQFHWWDYGTGSFVAAAKHLHTLQKEGLIRHVGLTNFSSARTKEISDAGVSLAVVQVQYSLLDRRPESDGMVDLCVERGIRMVCYGVLAGGFLKDSWLGVSAPDLHVEQENRSLTKYALIIEEFGGWQLFQQLLCALRTVADRHQEKVSAPVTIAQIATAWVLAQRGVGAVILGARNSTHLHSTRVSANMELNAEDMGAIQKVLDQAQGPVGEVYGLERTPKHGGVMRYNLNHAGTRLHLLELSRRCVRRHVLQLREGAGLSAAQTDLRLLGLLEYEVQQVSTGVMPPTSVLVGDTRATSTQAMAQRLVDELAGIGAPSVVCEGQLEENEKLCDLCWVLVGLLQVHLNLQLTSVVGSDSNKDLAAVVREHMSVSAAPADKLSVCTDALVDEASTPKIPSIFTGAGDSEALGHCRVVFGVVAEQFRSALRT